MIQGLRSLPPEQLLPTSLRPQWVQAKRHVIPGALGRKNKKELLYILRSPEQESKSEDTKEKKKEANNPLQEILSSHRLLYHYRFPYYYISNVIHRRLHKVYHTQAPQNCFVSKT